MSVRPSDVFLTLARHILLRRLAEGDPLALRAAIAPAVESMVTTWGQDPDIARRAVAYAVASVLPAGESAASYLDAAGLDPAAWLAESPEQWSPARVVRLPNRRADP